MSEILVCHYCQRELVGHGSDDLAPTRDHVVPRALGGLDVRWNRVWSCRACNSDKADKYPSCTCAFCSRTRRRHWEQLGIADMTKERNRHIVIRHRNSSLA